jgi:hypothetical protein
MNFNKHYNLEGRHAFLGASKYSWLNYDADKLRESYLNAQARYRGTQLHELASNLIKLGVKLPATHQTLNMFVNDAIGYRMQSEQILYFSDNCFGTADAISYKEKNKKLRIHDLKTGTTPASMKQLYIYTALFCLEYAMDPHDMDIELRIYQSDDIEKCIPETTDILQVMQQIRSFDLILKELREEEEHSWM